MSKYCILCDARKGQTLGIHTLALVDRAKTKELWWTSDNINILLAYSNKEAAKKTCSKFKNNGARVVSMRQAIEVITRQAEFINGNGRILQ